MLFLDVTGQILSTAFHCLYLALIVATILIVIADNRSPVKTMAWILVLFFLPVVGLVLYLLVGRSTRHERFISRSGYTRLVSTPKQMSRSRAVLTAADADDRVRDFFTNVGSALTFGGNSVEVYTDGYGMLSDLIRAISRARHHVHLQFYIFEDDAVGRLLRDVLIDRARQGVKVRLLYDDVGCWKVSKLFFDQMLCEGIEVLSFMKVRFPLFTGKVNYRNHRKIVVVDGEVGFIGGMNIAERYLRGFSWGVWRDTHVRIEGKAVYGLQAAFLTDWYAMDRSLLTAPAYYPQLEDRGQVLVQTVTSDPVGQWRDLMQGLVMAIGRASRYFYVQTPYFLPTEEVMTAFQSAALAGVDVRVMLPRKADAFLTHKGSLSYLNELMEAGVKVLLYRKGFLHSKLWVWDDRAASVGSANLDFRSFEHNFEANAFFYDRQTARRLKHIFLADQQHCIQLTPKLWARRSRLNKITESVVRLLAPLL